MSAIAALILPQTSHRIDHNSAVSGGGIYNATAQTVTGNFNGVPVPANTKQGLVVLDQPSGNSPDDIFN